VTTWAIMVEPHASTERFVDSGREQRNPLSGAPRIHGELLMLGLEDEAPSRATVSRDLMCFWPGIRVVLLTGRTHIARFAAGSQSFGAKQ